MMSIRELVMAQLLVVLLIKRRLRLSELTSLLRVDYRLLQEVLAKLQKLEIVCMRDDLVEITRRGIRLALDMLRKASEQG